MSIKTKVDPLDETIKTIKELTGNLEEFCDSLGQLSGKVQKAIAVDS